MQAFAIFKQHVPGRQNQERTALPSPPGQDIFVPFDNTNGNITTMAVVNPDNAGQTYSATLRVGSNPALGYRGLNTSSLLSVTAAGHLALATGSEFPAISRFKAQPNLRGRREPLDYCVALQFDGRFHVGTHIRNGRIRLNSGFAECPRNHKFHGNAVYNQCRPE
jgi:hypothetical protein